MSPKLTSVFGRWDEGEAGKRRGGGQSGKPSAPAGAGRPDPHTGAQIAFDLDDGEHSGASGRPPVAAPTQAPSAKAVSNSSDGSPPMYGQAPVPALQSGALHPGMMGDAIHTQLGSIAKFIRGISFKPDDVVPLGSPGSIACMRTNNVQRELDCIDVWAVDKRFVKRDDQILRACLKNTLGVASVE